MLVSLLDEREQSPRYDVGHATALGFVRHNIPVRDYEPPTVDQLEQLVTLVAGCVAKTIVHCQAGRGRTGTFAAAYWIAKGMDAHAAIAHVRKSRSGAVETAQQEAALADFAIRRKGR